MERAEKKICASDKYDPVGNQFVVQLLVKIGESQSFCL